MSRIDKKTVDWVCKIIRKDVLKNASKDDPQYGFLPAAIRVNNRLANSFFNIPKKDLHNKNKRAVFLRDAVLCSDTMLEKFKWEWVRTPFSCLSDIYYDNADEE